MLLLIISNGMKKGEDRVKGDVTLTCDWKRFCETQVGGEGDVLLVETRYEREGDGCFSWLVTLRKEPVFIYYESTK